MPVPWRGWGNIPVRVCNLCYAREQKQATNTVNHQNDNDLGDGKGAPFKLTENNSSHGVTHDSKKLQKMVETIDKTAPSAVPNKSAKIRSSGDGGRVIAADGDRVTARYVGEVVQSAVGLAAGVLQYSKEAVVESARPAYWEADSAITHCHQCKVKFSPSDHHHATKHHCRACGKGFCDLCTSQKEVVPNRGWDYPVRVCKTCFKILQHST